LDECGVPCTKYKKFLFNVLSSEETTNHSKQLKKKDPKTTQKTRNGGDRYGCRKWGRSRPEMREMVAGIVGAQISANFVSPIPAFYQPNLTHKKLKKLDLERKKKKPYGGWARRRWWFGWGYS
jgi:hypothetical protein